MLKPKDALTCDASASNRLRLSPFRNTISRENQTMTLVPHRGSLYRLDGDPIATIFVIEILVDIGQTHELHFGREDFDFFSRLFSILDTESRGLVGRTAVKDFVTLRCPVFWRRDEDLRRAHDLLDPISPGYGDSPTFDEVWKAVSLCSKTPKLRNLNENLDHVEIGVEAWMVFCRFIALAQYLEAKRRFSARHLQQTLRHRNAPHGSEVVVVDVPPPEPPILITPQELAEYEQRNNSKLPLPELDLDHSLLAAHDVLRRRQFNAHQRQGTVKISLFGSSSFSSSLMNSSSSSGSLSSLEFAVTYTAGSGPMGAKGEQVVVRRSFADMIWLNETFSSHKVLGGTMCGRILPPFPKASGNNNSSQFPNEESLLQSSIRGTGGAIAAAAASVGLLRDVAISFWGSYVAPPTPASEALVTQASTSLKYGKKTAPLSFAVSENYYNPNSPSGIARQLERFLNYLLEHPALSTSFPLNTILKASQSGLEAAKQSLREHARVSKELEKQTPHMEDGKLSIPFWPMGSGASSNSPPNLSWVRTAAQAAMALKVHGLLETTGLPSASARLQHASLPNFDNVSSRNMAWEDDDEPPLAIREIDHPEHALVALTPTGDSEESESFEQGVVQVESELATEFLQDDGDGYDMLPLPVPAPERRILTVGSSGGRSHDGASASGLSGDGRRQVRFHYGSSSIQTRKSRGEGLEEGYLGDMSVDENIDKLREVIGSVDNILSRCMVSSAGIGGARRERFVLCLDIMKGLDSWEGLRGKIISQRALMKGVSGLEQSKEVFEESDLALIDDVSWQNSLASCAVSAAEDVRSVVRAARTACSAKAAADAAAFTAQTACDNGKFATIEEARAAQTRASMAQSHAIHAAVVEHEAKTVKRRATLALAHDVKSWNVHRKREILLACISYARSQHEATRRAVDAWSCLRDGYLGSPVIPSHTRRAATTNPPKPSLPSQTAKPSLTDSDEVITTIYEDITSSNPVDCNPSIVAVDHEVLTRIPMDDVLSPKVNEKAKTTGLMVMPESLLPLVTASPILEEDEDLAGSQDDGVMTKKPDEQTEKEVLSASMQSLVNGLMNWGEQYDSEDDYALPAGMAASIVLEGSGAFKVPN